MIREFSGEDLDLVSEAEGTTGFISEVTIKVMPKEDLGVMATMLGRVEEQIEMPEYMREQMPDLMPKIMDRLMPHMIGDVVPLITQPMIDYLQGRRFPDESYK